MDSPALTSMTSQTLVNSAEKQGYKRVLRYVDNERTAGQIAVWARVPATQTAISASDAKQNVQAALSSVGQDGGQASTFAQALSPQIATETAPTAAQDGTVSAAADGGEKILADNAEEAFGFGDFVDMINPLQHIPLVNTIYRSLTGDTIKPISRMVGGVAYGGPMGAVVPLIDTAARQGLRDMRSGEASAMLSFADLSQPPVADIQMDRAKAAVRFAHEAAGRYND